ncbi:hypothetical protein NLM16_36990, partial [Bradyrhizobium brasilense]|uniref:hypothetical protein n=1 Tax=Bradyrhizobium brasilense TaxID=1419277 RepID=UPI0028777FDD
MAVSLMSIVVVLPADPRSNQWLPNDDNKSASKASGATSAIGRFCCKSRLLAMDCSAISPRTTGFGLPALTLSTQLYAVYT